MDEQTKVADRFRSLLLRVLVVIGGMLAGTALAWLLSSATASAAEPTPVSTLLSTAGEVVDNSVEHTVHIGQDARLAAQSLPAPSVPAIEVPVPHLVAPVILVEQRLDDFAGPRTDEQVISTAVTRTFVPVAVLPVPQDASTPAISRIDRVAEPMVAGPQSVLSTPVSPLRPDGAPKSEALPFGALPGGACGHDGPAGSSSGLALHDGMAVVPAAAPAQVTRASSRRVPMTVRRQPGITPD